MRRSMFAFAAVLNCLAILASSGTRAQDVVKVAVTPFGLPVAGLNAQTKAVEGIAPELMTIIAKDAGFQVQFQPYVIGEIGEALLQKKADTSASTFGPTPEREKVFAFSTIYGTSREVLLRR